MNVNLFFIRLILFFSLSAILISCAEKAPETIDAEKPVVLEVEKISSEIEEDVYEFIPPSPLQVASIFKKAGLEYDESLLCSTNNIDDYSTKFEQSLLFGIFSSDLAYCVKNEKYSEAGEYLKALRETGNKIGLETIFNSEDLIERFESNIGNQDSIIDILIFVQENTDDYIADNGKDELSVMYYTGAWIEGMYLGAKTVMEKGDKKVGILISEQMTIAEILLNGLTHISEQSEDIIDLSESIQDVIDSFYKLNSVLSAGDEIDYIDVELSTEELQLMSSKIVELRDGIVI